MPLGDKEVDPSLAEFLAFHRRQREMIAEKGPGRLPRLTPPRGRGLIRQGAAEFF
jgi:hypothetical protein